jgi:hypothetical protein
LTYNIKVIQLASPGLWTFLDFVYENGTNPIADWYRDDLSEDAQLLFNKVLKDCQKTERHKDWIAFKRFLSGKLREDKIWELEFAADKRRYRILGVFGPLRKQATLLIGCYHKMGNYTPTNALETASKRAKLLARKEATCCERKIRSDQ